MPEIFVHIEELDKALALLDEEKERSAQLIRRIDYLEGKMERLQPLVIYPVEQSGDYTCPTAALGTWPHNIR